MKLYQNGFVLSSGAGKNIAPPLRADCVGWSVGAVRRNRIFCLSVAADKCCGIGYAITLTIKQCPLTAAAFHRCRAAFMRWLFHRDLLRYHSVIEWQRRGVPHLHIAVWVASSSPLAVAGVAYRSVRDCWLHIARDYFESAADKRNGYYHAVRCDELRGVGGWSQYMAKHAGRGYYNIQRQGLPVGWEKSGRMWQYGGDWAGIIMECKEYKENIALSFRLRRVVWRRAVAFAREMLRRHYVERYKDYAGCLLPLRRGVFVFGRSFTKVVITIDDNTIRYIRKDKDYRVAVTLLTKARSAGSRSGLQYSSGGAVVGQGEIYYSKSGDEKIGLSPRSLSEKKINMSQFMLPSDVMRLCRPCRPCVRRPLRRLLDVENNKLRLLSGRRRAVVGAL